MGDYEVIRKEYRYSHLWVINVADAIATPQEGTRLTEGRDYTVESLSWSPDGTRIAFGGQINSDFVNWRYADIYVLDLSDTAVTRVVSQDGPDWGPGWSPDGTRIIFHTKMNRQPLYAVNEELAVVPAGGGDIRVLTGAFDEDPSLERWVDGGVYFTAIQRTTRHLFRLDPSTLEITRVSQPDDLIGWSFSLNRDASQVAFTATDPEHMSELYVADTKTFTTKRLTDMTAQVDSFRLGTREVIRWSSTDGTEIEGVLIKPDNFDPDTKYPLLCVIHGGPTWLDFPGLLWHGRSYYPVDIWADRGALILMVNYRGSSGYGEAFRRLNVRNLGVGDAWDVESGVDYLIGRGWVDPARVGCMGWSQGGYISAFLTASSDKFAAISVGAGISDWATYYYNTDITPFTIHYLGDDPVDDPDIYAKTSPMAYVKSASTPTLIQHGENDARVPTPNAYELRQALEDRGVPVELVIYKGFGHGISKPKSQRAVMWHNLVWFNHYLWGDDLPDLWSPDIPEEEVDSTEADASE
jgi:dipeptidyl aminopeptidase/acylaminoacyl peptidase